MGGKSDQRGRGESRDRLLRRPGRGSRSGLCKLVEEIGSAPGSVGPAGVGPLGAVVDCLVAARRLSGWSLWVELAGLAQLVAFWEAAPPISDELLAGEDDDVSGGFADPCRAADPDLADRLQHLVLDYQLPRPVDMHALAPAFVTSEVSAATGMSRQAVGLRLDAARALFLDDRLPRSREVLRAGLLDWTKLRTLVCGTQDLDDEACRAVEVLLVPDSDLAGANVDVLDVRSHPAHPGAGLPRIARMTNPALERALRAAIAAVDAEALAARAARARQRRQVRASALDDTMARLEIEAGQEAVAAVMNDLDAVVAAARAAGDSRTPDQIRADSAIHRLTGGAYGCGSQEAASGDPGVGGDASGDRPSGGEAFGGEASRSDAPPAGGEGVREAAFTSEPAPTTAGLAVSLTMTLSTWLGLADDPAVLDRFGPIPAALARQIAADAARDHPRTTTWRCIVVDDEGHGSVVAVADPLRTPRHDPPPRLSRLIRAMHPRCTFPGCAVVARRCELDHRVPYDHGDPGCGGATCSCNVGPLCGTHHRLKTAGLLLPEPVNGDPGAAPAADPGAAPGRAGIGDLRWTSANGRAYRYDAPPATPVSADPHDVAFARARYQRRSSEASHTGVADPELDQADGLGMPYDENWAANAWRRSLHEARQAREVREAPASCEPSKRDQTAADRFGPLDPPF